MGLQPFQFGSGRLESAHIWKDPCDPDVHVKLHITRCQNMSIDGSSRPTVWHLLLRKKKKTGSQSARHRVTHWKSVGSRAGKVTMGDMTSISIWMAPSMVLMPSTCCNGINVIRNQAEKSGGLKPITSDLRRKGTVSRRKETCWEKAWWISSSLVAGEVFLCGLGLFRGYLCWWFGEEKCWAAHVFWLFSCHSFLASRFDLVRFSLNLRRERDALNNHASQMMLQETWRMNRQLQTKIRTELNDVDGTFSILQKALIETCPTDHYGDCLRMRHFSITGIEQICNVRIWKDYEFRKEQVRKEVDGRLNVPAVTDGLPSRMCKWAHLDERINEVLLFHGTTVEKIDQIANFGSDERLARERGLYGQGVYFTDQSCKSLQHSGANRDNTGCFIIARVILGHPCDAQGPLKQLKVEQLVDPNDSSKGRCHSVLAKPGTLIPNPRSLVGGQRQLHREFVLFNGAQAYPEMIAHFIC